MYIDTIIVATISSIFILSASIFVNFLQHRYLLSKFLLMLFYHFVRRKCFYTEKKENTNILYLFISLGCSYQLWMLTFVSDLFNLVYKYFNYPYTHVFICWIIV